MAKRLNEAVEIRWHGRGGQGAKTACLLLADVAFSSGKTFRAAKPATMRALRSAYVGRKNKKRDYRKLWIARINAAARMNDISYSRLIDGLKKSSIDINRKMLSELAIHDPAAFAQLCETAKKAL